MQVTLNYGRRGLPLDIADSWDATVIRKKPMPLPEDPGAAVCEAFAHPVGCGTLAQEAAGKRTACIAICDITRPVPNSLFLPVMLRQLVDAGRKPENISIVIATGLHRPAPDAEIREMVVDDWVLKTFKIESHYAQNDDDHIFVGATTWGNQAKIDRRFVEADLRIVTGLVEPHIMAGYSGGRKVISPGLCHADTISVLHCANILDDPKVANCIVEGNPLHEEQLEIMAMIGRVLAVNTVIDEHRRLSFINFGEAKESHLQAVEYARPYMEVPVKGKFHTVVTSSAGYPLDCNYYQTSKGITAGMALLADGGTLLVASECGEGLGSVEFVEAQEKLCALGRNGFMKDILARPSGCIDEWGTQMILKACRTGKVGLYSDRLSDREMELTGCMRVTNMEEAVQKSIDESGDNRIAVIPEGPYVVPVASKT